MDLRDRVATLVHADTSGTVLASESYTRSASGEPTRIEREDGSATVFEYDAALRLTLERRLDDAGLVLSERSYSYDVDGNRLTRSTISGGLPAVETYSYGPGFRLASIDDGIGPQTYGHDAGGRVNAFDGNTIAYDSLDHVTSVSSGSASYSYTFDGEGRRVASTDGTLSREFLVAPNMVSVGAYESPMLVTDAGGAAVRSYVYAGEHAVMRVQDAGAGAEPTYYLRDAMGSVMALADSAGTRTARFEYDAFGEVDSATGADASLPAEGDFRHHGMWLDPTGLYYVRSRSYDANTGRFLTRDPVDPGMGVPEAWSPYVANLSNPLVYRDPEGLITLQSLGISDTISGILSKVSRIAARQALDYAKEEALGLAGEAFFRAIGGMLPIDISGVAGALGGSFARQQGDAFETLLNNGLCDFFDSGGVGSSIHLEVAMSAGSGRPLSNGISCPIDIGSANPRTVAAPNPDLLFSKYQPADFSRRSSKRSYLVADIKLRRIRTRAANGRVKSQFRAMVMHGNRSGGRHQEGRSDGFVIDVTCAS